MKNPFSKLPPETSINSEAEPQPSDLTSALSDLPDGALVILPVRDAVLFPTMVRPLTFGRAQSIAAVQTAMRFERPVGVVLQRDPSVDIPTIMDIHAVGTEATVLRYVTARNGSHHVICGGRKRFTITEPIEGFPFLAAQVEYYEEPGVLDNEIEALSHQLRFQATEGLKLLPDVPPELLETVAQVTSVSELADLVASYLDIDDQEKQTILELFPLKPRLEKVVEYTIHWVEVLRLSQEIGDQTREKFDERQRRHVLEEQIKTIRKQLGDDEDRSAEFKALAQTIADKNMPPDIEAHAKKELRRLEHMPEDGSEYSMLRTYLDTLVELPWAPPVPAPIDLQEARENLDKDHFGMDKIKRRILEYLAVRRLAPDGPSPILCFVGPPGVGKTSLGKSIARAMNRKFARISLGGVHDESEIRGHRRTYIGALPGNIIEAIRKTGARDCVFMLDEMDKLSSGVHGDPSSALLEVLDPEQNNSFRDNYLAVPFDLSKIVFIGTANVIDNVPGPLRDRMEVIELPGYTAEEKLEIARRYIVDRQLAANGLTANQCKVTDDALISIITNYTREAGCRNLERELSAVVRNAAVAIAEEKVEEVKITPADVERVLGPRRFENDVVMRTSLPGVATGLAWTPAGGDILFIEASRSEGTGRLTLTGQLGDVMKESAQAALSLLRARHDQFGKGLKFDNTDIHIHVPAGAIPKDGPSAGVAMFVALVSLFTGRTVRSDTAMTGEISLRGLVLPIGGVKEKAVAAARAGVHRVIFPMRNKKDFEEIPESARTQLEFVWVESVTQAVEAALEGAPAGVATTASSGQIKT